MFKKVVIVPTLLLISLCMAVLDVSANSNKNRRQAKRAASDNLVYTQIFRLVNDFETEAEKLTDAQAKNHFKNYFVREAGLTEDQQRFLKIAAANFANAADAVAYREALKISSRYRNELKNFFGAAAFERFEHFAKSQMPDNCGMPGQPPCYGTSGISINQTEHKLYGFSRTFYYTRNAAPESDCSVSATMSGPNVSENAFSSNCSNGTNPLVTLVSSSYLPNSQYCVNGFHNSGGNTGTSSDCLTSPGDASKIIYVEFEQIETDDLPIDANPNAGGGVRIFPDQKNPTETISRRKIRVKAKIGANMAGNYIYFRNFDFDDPSASGAPIDPENTTNAGDDNKGNVDGTPATKAGQFSLPNPNPQSCQTTSYGAKCFTNSSGETEIDFILTMQPGDNFAVAASTDENYLTGLTLAADGVNLKDASNNQTPAFIPGSQNACAASSLNACRTDMLTVWRRLHIEDDSMDESSGNNVAGDFPSAQTLAAPVATLQVNVSSALEPNRFENGRLEVGGRSFEIYENTTTSISISVGRPYSITAGQTFVIYDDDDFNSNNGLKPKDGDQKEDIPLLEDDFIRDNDIFPVDITTTNSNALAPAYIRPKYDLAGSEDDVPFLANIPSDTPTAIQNAFQFDSFATHTRADFWTVYLLSGYQHVIDEDGDPITETNDMKLTKGVSDGQRGQGSIVFLETHAAHECLTGVIDCSIQATKVHEIGHLLDADHNQGGVMDNVSVNFSEMSINIIRTTPHP